MKTRILALTIYEQEIMVLHLKGETAAEIAARYNCDAEKINSIITLSLLKMGNSWNKPLDVVFDRLRKWSKSGVIILAALAIHAGIISDNDIRIKTKPRNYVSAKRVNIRDLAIFDKEAFNIS